MAQPLGRAARRDTAPAGERIDDRGDPRRRPQTGLEQRTHELPVTLVKTRQGPAIAGFEVGHHVAGSGVALEDLVGREGDAVFGEAFDVGLNRQRLAVDQHAVAIEDDEIERHGHDGGTPARSSAAFWRSASTLSSKSSISSWN